MIVRLDLSALGWESRQAQKADEWIRVRGGFLRTGRQGREDRGMAFPAPDTGGRAVFWTLPQLEAGMPTSGFTEIHWFRASTSRSCWWIGSGWRQATTIPVSPLQPSAEWEENYEFRRKAVREFYTLRPVADFERQLTVGSQSVNNGGRGGIRTPGSLATTPDFESGAFNHSATLPTDYQ